MNRKEKIDCRRKKSDGGEREAGTGKEGGRTVLRWIQLKNGILARPIGPDEEIKEWDGSRWRCLAVALSRNSN